MPDERKENIRYSALVGLHTMTMCVGFNFVTYYLSGSGLKESYIGTVVSVSCLLAVIIQQISGRLVDSGKADGKKLLKTIALLEAISGFLLFFVKPVFISAVLFGILLAVTLIMAPLINSFSFYYKSSGISVNYGIARGVGSLCFSGISMLLGYMTVHSGREVVPLTYGLIGLSIFFTAVSMPVLNVNRAVESEPEKKKPMRFSDYPGFIWMLVGLSLVMLFHNMVMTYFIHVIERIGGDSGNLGMAIGIAAIVEIPVLFLYTKVKGNRPSSVFLTISGMAFLAKAVLFIFARTILMIYLIQCLQCLAYGLMAASRVYYVDELMGEKYEATGQAYISATETLGLVLGSAIGGIIMQNYGTGLLLTSGAVFCAIGAALMLISNIRR
ncbi:MFS transporter [Oribacterium sp. FC2011]|uniref:MFS transporter n=1 Tax=Oribacterium sp. FC2011 TaxID=1408311 RepID=UPI0004E229B4|nr:MFS transporter [Oribacterium sp. FC2011]